MATWSSKSQRPRSILGRTPPTFAAATVGQPQIAEKVREPEHMTPTMPVNRNCHPRPTVDDASPALPIISNIPYFPLFRVLRVMQDVYHQQYVAEYWATTNPTLGKTFSERPTVPTRSSRDGTAQYCPAVVHARTPHPAPNLQSKQLWPVEAAGGKTLRGICAKSWH